MADGKTPGRLTSLGALLLLYLFAEVYDILVLRFIPPILLKEPGLRLPASASLPLASCWPRPQQLLPVSATGGGRRRCTSSASGLTDSARTASPTKRKAPGEVATPWGLFFLVYRMEYPHNSIFSICHSPQKSSVAQKVYRNCRTAAFHFFQSCVSFRMPNSLRSKPLRHLGLLRTTTCIEPTTFRRLIRHYRRPAPGMFRFSSGSARPAPSPPPPARPFGWRW